MSTPARRVVLTCAQPTGQLTLGNYLGAIRPWTTWLDGNECYFGIVDYHSMTVPYVPADLRRNCYRLLSLYVAAGLDPERCHLFLQSHVQGHTELAWILGCVTGVGELERMTQFKDKSARTSGERIGVGLLTYPVLMAADILIYNADVVPVGEDQKQHVELCRDLAERFNRTYSPTFTVPEVSIPTVGARVRSLQDPTRKMSKSDPDPKATLFLLDPPDVIRRKVGSAVTDSGSEVRLADDKPGIANLLGILAACTGRAIPDLEAEFAGRGYAPFKEAVAEAVVELLKPIQDRYAALEGDRERLDAILAAGAAAAGRRAARTMSKVRRKVGLVEPARG